MQRSTGWAILSSVTTKCVSQAGWPTARWVLIRMKRPAFQPARCGPRITSLARITWSLAGNTIIRAAHNLVAGLENTANNDAVSVTGGYRNSAMARWSSVSGGFRNRATGDRSSVGGGSYNVASGGFASVSGGGGSNSSGGNNASGNYASVGGGSCQPGLRRLVQCQRRFQ